MEALGGLMNEEVMASFRKSLHLPPVSAASAPITPPPTSSLPLTIPTSLPAPGGAITPPSGSPSEKISSSRQANSPSNGDRSTPRTEGHDETPLNGSVSSKPPSESGGQSPIRVESRSPPPTSLPMSLNESLSPMPPGHPLSGYPGLNVSLPLPMPLNMPPLISSGGRIPKSDPMEGRLQDMLRYNMEKYAGQAIDTLASSRRVRELLSIHNIGQRLFAKYVLGLSQGTVSELLSKPKSWDKLTEKGRDSYRKMHAWAYDDSAVMLLKSLIPRKGELMRSVSSGPPMHLKGKQSPNSPLDHYARGTNSLFVFGKCALTFLSSSTSIQWKLC